MITATIKNTLILGVSTIMLASCVSSVEEVTPNLTSKARVANTVQYSSGDSLLIGLGVFDITNQTATGFDAKVVHQVINDLSISYTSLASNKIEFEFKWNGNLTNAKLDLDNLTINFMGGGVPTGAITYSITDSEILTYSDQDLKSPISLMANLAHAIKLANDLDGRTPRVPTTPMAPNFKCLGRGGTRLAAFEAARSEAERRCGMMPHAVAVMNTTPTFVQDKNGNWIVLYSFSCMYRGVLFS